MTLNLKKLFSFKTLIILFITACLICMIPYIQNQIILLMESFLGRSLRNIEKWQFVITHVFLYFCTLAILLYFLMYTNTGKKIWKNVKQEVTEIVFSQNFKKYCLILFFIYFICYFALLCSDFYYKDDIRRAMTGHKGWLGYSRFLSESLSVFLHTNFWITDIAPLTFVISMGILVFASYLIAYIITNKNVSLLSLFAAGLLGLSPFYIENISYKFDSPYMALAVLFGIIPFLFTGSLVTYIFTSFISITLICTSYQAANGIYILFVIIMSFKMWQERKTWKDIGIFVAISIACYSITMIYFRVALMVPGYKENQITNLLHESGYPDIILYNLKRFFYSLVTRYGNIWIKLFTIPLLFLFPLAAKRNNSKKGKIAFLFAIATEILMLVFSLGAYLIIEDFFLFDRVFIGFDFFIAVIAVYATLNLKNRTMQKYFTICVIVCLFYGFGVNATVKGNLYSKQKDYETFRTTLLLNDLSDIVNPENNNKAYLIGIMGPASLTYRESTNYNYDIGSFNVNFLTLMLTRWNMDLHFEGNASIQENNINPILKEKLSKATICKDCYYHSILTNEDNEYFIILKNPQVDGYKIK